jgi:hypothetical protein
VKSCESTATDTSARTRRRWRVLSVAGFGFCYQDDQNAPQVVRATTCDSQAHGTRKDCDSNDKLQIGVKGAEVAVKLSDTNAPTR